MDIIVTTPKSQMANAAQEAADAVAGGGGHYFRRFPLELAPEIEPGDRVYYVEDGYIRGFAVVYSCGPSSLLHECETTGRRWPPGYYVFMKADSWTWIRPIPMLGFQGFRYARPAVLNRDTIHVWGVIVADVVVAGGWLDPRPEVEP